MVKADAKRDYYADLDLPPTADAEEIKKQFRVLAKLYHPDRNPGREVEFVAKFQAVQAAHEILCDPQQKAKYDAERSKQEKMAAAAQAFRRNPPQPPPQPMATNFPPPPRRTTTGTRGATFPVPGGRGRPVPSSGAEKFAAFTRAGAAQQAKADEEAARAQYDAVRGFRSMRNGQPQGFSGPPPPPPPPPRHPTAPRTAKSFDQFQHVPQSGFPGMARTASTRKAAGFAPNTPGGDEPMAARTSAYTNYAQGQRPQVSNPQSYFPDSDTPVSPQSPKHESADSPLRQTQSSSTLHESSTRPQRPDLNRISTRYVMSGGERTFVNGVGRSSSVRNSPVDREWAEHDRDGLNRPHTHNGPIPRHHSASPKLRPTPGLADISSSESDSDSDREGGNLASRKKAQPRAPRQKAGAGGFAFRHVTADDPDLTSQFPPTSHKHLHSPQDEYTLRYEYPPPPPRTEYAGHRTFPEPRGFQNKDSPRMNGNNGSHARDSSSGVPKTFPNMYGPFYSPPKTWSEDWGFSPSKIRKACPSLNGLPSWAVPSSVLPKRKHSAGNTLLETIREEDHGKAEDWLSNPNPRFKENLSPKANRASPNSFAGTQQASQHPYPQNGSQSVSQENINTTFSAADWDGKFNSGDELFRPTETLDRKSPSHASRTRARSVGKARVVSPHKEGTDSEPIDLTNDNDRPKVPEIHVQDTQEEALKSPEQAFLPGKFSAEKWAKELKDQKWSIPTSELNSNKPKTPKKGSRSNGTRRPTLPPKLDPNDVDSEPQPSKSDPGLAAGVNGNRRVSAASADAMDIDSTFSDAVPSMPPGKPETHDIDQLAPKCAYPTRSDVNLGNLANVAPFAPSSTGLKDLDDLSTTLPFESRPAPAVDLSKKISSMSRDLRLPKPPKPVIPPLHDDFSRLTWERYVADMNAYFYDWSVFNKRMIEHFRSRQEQVDMSMASHWISMAGDGRLPEELDGAKAGYATFMAWLEDDAKCREWWNVANERHRQCFEDLGKMRAKAKATFTPILA